MQEKSSIDIGPSPDPSIFPNSLQLQCTYPAYFQSQHIIASCISSVSDPNASPSFVPSGDPSFSRGSNLHLFAFNSELNLHSDDVSRVDSSTNPSIDPSYYLIMCPIDDPDRDSSLHPFDSNSEAQNWKKIFHLLMSNYDLKL